LAAKIYQPAIYSVYIPRLHNAGLREHGKGIFMPQLKHFFGYFYSGKSAALGHGTSLRRKMQMRASVALAKLVGGGQAAR
jgi:hypothetical protein